MKRLIKVLLAILLLITTGCAKEDNNIHLKQEKVNYRNIKIDLNDVDYDYDSINVTYKMYYQNKVCLKDKVHLDKNDNLSFEVPYYGEYEVLTKIYKNNKCIAKNTQKVAVTAKHYNVAPLIATTPVLIFSLKYFYEIPTTLDNGDPIPTIITLAREKQYDWDNLADGMFKCPYLNKKDITETDFAILNKQMPKIKDYIADLHRLDPSSTFTFYINDQHMGSVLVPLVFENNLDDDLYQLVFITDGGGTSYRIFKGVYDNTDDAFKVHNQKIEEYKKIKQDIKNGKTPESWMLQDPFGQYIYAAVDAEKDAKWWVIRKSGGDTFKIQDEKFLQYILDDERVSNNYINNLLKSVKEKGKDDELKKLYKFEDEVFDNIYKQDKEVMMILGTSNGIEANEPIDEYFKITKTIYGDKYGYVYKGHPGNIPDEKRIKELKALGMDVVDASIAAEIFMFYHPDVKLAGYPSTTYVSSQADENNIGLYLLNKERALHNDEVLWLQTKEYASTFDIFISKLESATDEGLKDLAVNKDVYELLPNENHQYYLVEYNDDDNKLGLWDVEDQKLYIFKDRKLVNENE